jgi:hypothetical protein
MRRKSDHGETSYKGSDRLKRKAAVPRMKPGSAIVNFSAGLAQMLAGNP